MTLTLGDGWFAPPVLPVAGPYDEPDLTTDDLRYEQLMVALATLREALVDMPAPQVHVSAPDLSAIVMAVQGLKGSATADDIARAVVGQISPGGEPAMTGVLDKLVTSLERLDFRMKGGTGGGVAPSSPDVTDRPLRQLGTVTVANFPATTAGLTDGQLRATPVPVSTGLTQTTPLTDVQLRAAAVPVSGTVTVANPTAVGLTDSQLRAAAVAVSGAFFPAVQPVSQPNSAAAGTLTNLNDVVTLNAQGMNGYSAVVTGTWSGVITLEASVDGVTWNPINGALQGVGTFSTTLTANTQIRGTLGGLSQFRMRLSTVGGGTANVAVNAGSGTAGVFMTAPIPLASPTRAQTARIAVGTTAVQLDTSPLVKRRAIEIRYNSNGATAASFVYVGFNGAVTAATGRELSAGESMHLDLSEVTQMWVIASAAAQPVQFTELGE